MQDHEGKTYYGIEYIYFSFLGFWQLLNGGLRKRNKVVLTSSSYMIIYFCFLSTVMYDITFNDYSFSTFTEKLSVNMKILESVVKMGICFVNRDGLSILLGLFSTELLLSARRFRKRSDPILTKNAQFVNKGTKGFIYLISATALAWMSAPLVKCITAPECGSMNIFPSWYPFDTGHFPINFLIYLLEITLMLYGASLIYNVNCMFSALALTATAQFDVLSGNLENLETDAVEISKTRAGTEESENCLTKQIIMEALLKECIIDHQTLLWYLHKMEDVYNKIFLFQMFMSTQTICLVLVQLNYNLASGEELSPTLAMKFIMYLLLSWSELFLYSWGGQIIQNKSETVYWSLQKCGWNEGSQKFKKHVCIALTRSYHPFGLSAGKFGLVNLTTFTQVIRASYSLFTFLHGSQKN
ncbi:Odorant receptor [Nesidiocoris tenuis]|uniref:Odorant receptor n=1 Tax=Nesidiocoris tenuis TaxID=355587 RepID=A0ABN7B4M4_9HEMI|nr:Odorant receptor [Nesidiocoris tenuis]